MAKNLHSEEDTLLRLATIQGRVFEIHFSDVFFAAEKAEGKVIYPAGKYRRRRGYRDGFANGVREPSSQKPESARPHVWQNIDPFRVLAPSSDKIDESWI